ncbi:unnamed protein product [Bursaphelenchus xylophilus]|uniref:UV excision repair protein RAD23 n=1 Tax=Bursaphelenchus xylophilus TaxID=6326 RepID=A0A1I7SWK7_BURXY|nr:unnamed protein product [Bursaphelenchus xylophilus]CAG9099592.1 unnamed protein product [Bursaphelenchus xylophilus]
MGDVIEVTFKTITQQSFVFSFAPDITVGEIKKKIEEDKGANDYEVERQKLIYNGKILEDTQILKDINVDPKKYVVVMVSRKKPVEQPKPEEKKEPEKESTPTTVSTTAATSSTPAVVAAPDAPATESALTPDQEEQVSTLVAMGYARDDAVKALRAAFFNADRAVEYLCTGIPDGIDDAPSHALDEPIAEQDEPQGDALAFLRDSPQFAQICQIVRSNPAMLPDVLSQVSQSNPELFDAIRQNQNDFLRMLNDESIEGGQDEGEGGALPHDAGHMTIAITEGDRDAIQRLRSMGFPEQLVIEAYFACDKNEDLAVNYILSRMEES